MSATAGLLGGSTRRVPIKSVSRDSKRADRRQRPEIQALRAAAVLAVVIYHLWPGRLPGGYVGVDVFFVISGFLITSHILRDLRSGQFRLRNFWARRIRRLLPASLLVLAVTAVSVLVWVPQSLWQQWLREIGASALYVENWVLAVDSVDYLAAENQASPVQHFWSLSVEEQFYLLWPLLLLLGVALAVLLRRATSRLTTVALLSVVVAGSFAAGLWLTASSPSVAYFSTFVRTWEFGAGGLLALLPVAARSKPVVASAASWLGWALIAGSAFLFTSATPFPGYAALAPVLGAVLVIGAGSPRWKYSPRKTMSLIPVRFLGDVSYSVYLWHWPMIVIVPFIMDGPLTTPAKIGILLASIVAGWMTFHWVERPVLAIRGQTRLRVTVLTFGGAAVAMGTVLVVCAVGWQIVNTAVQEELPAARALALANPPCFGAAARPLTGGDCVNPELNNVMVPAPLVAAEDVSTIFDGICGSNSSTDSRVLECRFGDQNSPVRIALVGDSHAAQFASAVEQVAEDNGWALQVFRKGGCAYSSRQRPGEPDVMDSCAEWNTGVKDALVAGDFDIVVTSMLSGVEYTGEPGESSDAAAVKGITEAWEPVIDRGTQILAIRDNPQPIQDVELCLDTRGASASPECSRSRDSAILEDPLIEAVSQFTPEGARLVDFSDVYCTAQNCEPVIGGVTVYRDSNHLTDTFARTLAPRIEMAISTLLKERT